MRLYINVMISMDVKKVSHASKKLVVGHSKVPTKGYVGLGQPGAGTTVTVNAMPKPSVSGH